MRAHIVPDFAGQNGGSAVEGNQGNPDAHPASNLVAQCVLDTSRLHSNSMSSVLYDY